MLDALLQSIPVPVGPASYAEPFDPGSLLKMPANALVNLGYLLVAAHWLRATRGWPAADPRAPARGHFVAFALLGALYGPIQFWRIVTQDRLPAVLDQWVTLPFFAYLGAWNLLRRPGGAPAWLLPAVLAASVASYGLVLLHPDGFVIALALHILFAVGTSLEALHADGYASLAPFGWALLCCTGFVALKEADFALAHYAPFQRLTGHFWSKVCDFGQIHFALRFVEAGYLARVARPAEPARAAA